MAGLTASGRFTERMNQRLTKHLWALVVPIVLVAAAFLFGTLLLGYWPAFLRSLFAR